MVLLMRSNYGFQGFKFPETPRSARTARVNQFHRVQRDSTHLFPMLLQRKVPASDNVEDDRALAFEYLAVAAATRLEYEACNSNVNPTVKQEETLQPPIAHVRDHPTLDDAAEIESSRKEEMQLCVLGTYSGPSNYYRCPPRKVTASRLWQPLPVINESSMHDNFYPLKKRKRLQCGTNENEENVRFRIQSLEIPEMHFEISESETISALKRKVANAMVGLLERGVQIGVLLKGESVGDDNLTLLQTGIPHLNQLGCVGFCLERHCNSNSNSNPNSSTSKEMVVIPPQRKTKQSKKETSKRRLRRPFKVSEVEALVLAVENLGTGRWRDVKELAFNDTAHRTYVDLKDKWKTLVHTANLLPHQRRGAPVPQGLLDKVLAIHRFWSQQPPPEMPCLEN